MFTKMIEELIEEGLTEQRIGQLVGASQPTINRIKRTNQNPKYDLGVAIVALHKQVIEDKPINTPESQVAA
jgi:predicted transcriptional regulator